MQGTQQDPSSRQYQTPDDGPQQRLDQFLDGLNGMLNTLINATIQQEGAGSTKFIVNEIMDFVEQIGGATIMGAFMGKMMNKARGARDLRKIPKYKPKDVSTIGDDAADLHRGFKITDNETAKRLQEIANDPTRYERNMDAIQNYFSRDVTNQAEFNGTHGPALLGPDYIPNDQLLEAWKAPDGPASRLTKIENPAQRIAQIQDLLENPIQRPFQGKIYEAMLRNPELSADGKTFAELQADKYRPHLNGEPLPADSYTKGLSQRELDALTAFRGGPEGAASARIQEWINSFENTSQKDRLRRAFTTQYKKEPTKVPGTLKSVLGMDPKAPLIENPELKGLQSALLKYPTKFTNLSEPTLRDAARGEPTWKGDAKLEKKYKKLSPKKAQDILDKKARIQEIIQEARDQDAQNVAQAILQQNPLVAQAPVPAPIPAPAPGPAPGPALGPALLDDQAAWEQAREEFLNEAQRQIDNDNLLDRDIVNDQILQQPLGQQIQRLVMAQPQAFPAVENIMEARPARQAVQHEAPQPEARVPFKQGLRVQAAPKAPVFKKGHSPLIQKGEVRQNYIDSIVYDQAAKRRALEQMLKAKK